VVPLPAGFDGEPDDCMAQLAGTAREFGDLCSEVAKSLADGSISDNELARIDRESGQLIASLSSLRESLSRRNQAGKPAAEKAVR
jgi:hypothetical protein